MNRLELYKPKGFTRGLRRMVTDFLTRVREDCAASDTWACVLLDNLGRPKPDSASGAGWLAALDICLGSGERRRDAGRDGRNAETVPKTLG